MQVTTAIISEVDLMPTQRQITLAHELGICTKQRAFRFERDELQREIDRVIELGQLRQLAAKRLGIACPCDVSPREIEQEASRIGSRRRHPAGRKLVSA